MEVLNVFSHLDLRSSKLELWGGIECTINRVGNEWFDQLELSGHAHRLADLDLIAGIGIRTLRYPILWEATAPDSPDELDWRWADSRLSRLRVLGISPIVGLVHHGSGPAYTSLADDSFAPGLATFAARVAARFPWIQRFTPVNEPLTTSRFSGLYGHWYPHGRTDRCFARVFINQCRATVLAMQAIRCWNVDAKLVQTEDLGTTYSTPHLHYQRDFDNRRRWLTWDVLCGRLNRHHPLHTFLIGCGISTDELDWFIDNPCPPEVIGINHYVTSDRYLDERTAHYASDSVGGNGREAYADVEAVRVLRGEYRGFRVVRDAWERYRLPIALTEVHLGSSREEQLRWLLQAWHAARDASKAGCDVRAVATWALFGTVNWDTLLTTTGSYEPGAFDVRGPRPRPTAIAELITQLNGTRATKLPVAHGSGWWQRSTKVLYGEADGVTGCMAWLPCATDAAPVLICGATGSLGRAIAQACRQRGLAFHATTRSQLDVCDRAAVGRLLATVAPWAIINATGFVRIDDAERQRAQCFHDNTTGAAVLMDAARDRDISLLTFSTDMVFDGATTRPYVESSQRTPINEYGRCKVAAEDAVLRYEKTLCVRTAACFGCWDRGDVISEAMGMLAQGRRFCAASDVLVSPTYLPDLAGACLDLLIDGQSGIFHLTNRGALSWADFINRAAAAMNIDCQTLHPVPHAQMNWVAQRPCFSVLDSERAALMPTLDNALRRYAASASGIRARNHGRQIGAFG